jgi:RNA polymerase sigma-70 factor (ECF subfamily)
MTQAERESLVMHWREQWHPLLLQILAQRLPVPADVSDLAQEVYLRLLRVDKLDLIQDPRAYLCRVAVNIASEWRLRSARLPTTPSEDLPEGALAAADDLEQWLDNQQNRSAVQAALVALPVNHRTALVLHVTKDMSYPQIAEHMGVTGRQVKRYLAKAYDRLRREIIEAEIRRRPTQAGNGQ